VISLWSCLLQLATLTVYDLSPVHTSDNIAKNGDIAAETGNIVANNTMLPVAMSPVSATMSPFFGDIVAGVDGTLVARTRVNS